MVFRFRAEASVPLYVNVELSLRFVAVIVYVVGVLNVNDRSRPPSVKPNPVAWVPLKS